MNLQPFLDAGWVIQLHAISAFAALGVGAVLMLAPKGTIPHRTMGWTFAVLMVTVAATAVFIRQINHGTFSWIHVFVPLTFYSITIGLLRAKRHDVVRHRNAMRGLFFGALLVPGLVAFAPGRLMHAVAFG